MSERDEYEAELLAADAIGDVIEHWGFRKALGRVWTVLYMAGEPMDAASVGERLAMSAGGVSTTLTDLQRWGVVRRVWRPGERKEFYEAETDFWKMISKVVHERERFLVRSVRERLDEAATRLRAGSSTGSGPGGTRARLDRLRRLTQFASMADTVIESFLTSQQADFSEFSALLSLTRSTARRVSR